MHRLLAFACLLLLLGSAGCAMVPSWAGGDSSAEVALDDEFESRETAELGQTVLVHLPRPRSAGYTLAGVSFDPTMLRLDSVLDDPDDPEEVVYAFMPLETGITLVRFRAKAGSEHAPEPYRVLELRIEE